MDKGLEATLAKIYNNKIIRPTTIKINSRKKAIMMKRMQTTTNNNRMNTMTKMKMVRMTSKTTVKCTKIKIKMATVKTLKEVILTPNSNKKLKVKATPKMDKNMMKRKRSMRWILMKLNKKESLN
jgi:hypothetical protein